MRYWHFPALLARWGGPDDSFAPPVQNSSSGGGGSDTRGGRVSWGAQGGSGCRIIHLLNRVHPDALMQYQIFFFLIFLNIFWVWGCAKCVMFKIFINTTLNILMWESSWLRGNEHSVYCSRFFFFFPLFQLWQQTPELCQRTRISFTPVQLVARHKYCFVFFV